MLCSFCGTDNRAENKFCGMCGVRLERRLAERRTASAPDLKCGSCGHANESGFRFCGMCGSRIERRMQERRGTGASSGSRAATAGSSYGSSSGSSGGASSVATMNEPEPPMPTRLDSSAGETYRHGITGPSFLGLGDEPEEEGSYLLEDEQSSRGGLRKLVLLAILVAIIGLIFVQWRSNFRASPKANPQELPPAVDQQQPQGKNDPGPLRKGAHSDGTSGINYAEELALVPSGPPADPAPDPPTDANPPPVSRPQADPAAAAAVSATHLDRKPSSALLRAQQYLQGRGVPQDCEQGLLYLKAATEEDDPGADVQMGALYASGHCVQQDRVQAYRWLSSAHQLEPGNPWIRKNLDELWAQMTPQERHQLEY